MRTVLPPALLVAALACERPGAAPDTTAHVDRGEECATGLGRVGAAAATGDGALLVIDLTDPAVVLVDCEARTRTQLGKVGDGPGEYRQPAALVTGSGAGHIVFDRGSGRVTRWNSGLELVESAAGPYEAQHTEVRVDLAGRVYYTDVPATSPIHMSPADRPGRVADSSLVYRWDPETGRVDSLASILIRGAEWVGRVGKFPVRFGAEDLWGVSPDGMLWVVRAGDLSLEVRGAEGAWRRGQANPWEPIKTGPGDRRMMRAPGGSPTDSVEWPTSPVKPPVHVAVLGADSSVWVAMSRRAGERGEVYRVFDERGALSNAQYALPTSTRLLTVSRGALFLAVEDSLGLTTIYRTPRPDR